MLSCCRRTSAPFILNDACAPVQEVGKQHTKAALMNDLLFVSTFFVCRLLFGPVVVYRTLRCRSSHRVVKWGGAGIQCVSFFWFYRMLQARMVMPSVLRFSFTSHELSLLRVRRLVHGRPEPSGRRGRVADVLRGPLPGAWLLFTARVCLCQRLCYVQLPNSS